uniref:Uncharacterized protein n=1 Tax=Arundo donax TaxID=35708 RepID=A0A0A9A2B0_ARUDO
METSGCVSDHHVLQLSWILRHLMRPGSSPNRAAAGWGEPLQRARRRAARGQRWLAFMAT